MELYHCNAGLPEEFIPNKNNTGLQLQSSIFSQFSEANRSSKCFTFHFLSFYMTEFPAAVTKNLISFYL